MSLNLPEQALEPLQPVGVSSSGTIFEQAVEITDEQGTILPLRRIVVQLKQPTRHGDRPSNSNGTTWPVGSK